MRFLSRRAGARPRFVAIGVLVAAVALGGAVKLGSAATTRVSAQIVVLNDSSPLILGTATPGGNMGYDLVITNTGATTLQRVTFTDTIGPNGSVAYVNSADPAVQCSGVGTSTLTCFRDNLAAGAGFDVTVLFKTDPNAQAGDPLVNTLSGTIGTGPNPGPNDGFSASVTRSYSSPSGGSLTQSLALAGDTLTAGGAQTSRIELPPGFLNGFNFVGVTLQNLSGPAGAPPGGCGTVSRPCLPFETSTTIPPAATFNTTGPFFNGTSTAGYRWSFVVPVSNTFTVRGAGVFHTDANNQNGQVLPECVISGGQPQAPTTAPGLCVASKTLNTTTNPHTVTYTGLGIANGHTWGF
jgi:uncharacterized repeat protein (TIGR01451 family)